MSIILQIRANFYVISLQVLTKKKQITRRVYQDSWSPGILKTTMELFQKQLTAIIIFASCNYFHNISLPCPLVHEINGMFFNTGLIFTPGVIIQCKTSMRVPGSRDREPWILIYLLKIFPVIILYYFWLSKLSNLSSTS